MKFPQKRFEDWFLKETSGKIREHKVGERIARPNGNESARWGFQQAKKVMLAKIKERKEILKTGLEVFTLKEAEIQELKTAIAQHEWLEGELKVISKRGGSNEPQRCEEVCRGISYCNKCWEFAVMSE